MQQLQATPSHDQYDQLSQDKQVQYVDHEHANQEQALNMTEQQPGAVPVPVPVLAPVPRLNYEETQSAYRDLPCLILFIVHLLVVLILAFALGPNYTQQVQKVNNTTTTTTSTATSSTANSHIISIMTTMAIMGGILAAIWLMILKRFAASIITISFYMGMACTFIGCIVAFSSGAIGLGIVLLLAFVFSLLYLRAIRRFIPFNAALQTVACQVLNDHSSVMFVAYGMLLLQVAWIALWAFVFVAVNYKTASNGFVQFLLLLSFYWTSCIFNAVVHVTNAGVTATWLFYPGIQNVRPAFHRAVTTSLGSICFGALIVSLITTLRVLIRSARGRDDCQRAVVNCLLACFESITQFVNFYAYIYIAIYGKSYIQSASEVFQLLSTRGFDVIVNEDLTDQVIGLGTLMSGIVCGLIAGVWASSFTADWVPYVLLAFLIGAFMAAIVLSVLKSTVMTILICLAESPAEISVTRPEAFHSLRNAIAEAYGDKFENVVV